MTNTILPTLTKIEIVKYKDVQYNIYVLTNKQQLIPIEDICNLFELKYNNIKGLTIPIYLQQYLPIEELNITRPIAYRTEDGTIKKGFLIDVILYLTTGIIKAYEDNGLPKTLYKKLYKRAKRIVSINLSF